MSKKISINSLDKIIEENFSNVVTADWHDVTLEIKKSLSLTEMLEFVSDVVSSVFQDENGFIPEVADFAIKSNIVLKYTNVSLPDNIEHRYEILYNTDLIEFIRGFINAEQLHEIVTSIGKKISHKCNIAADNLQKQLTSLVSTLEKMQDTTTEIFEKITPEDLAKVMSAFENGDFSEEKIVQAYIDQTKSPESENVPAPLA